MLTFLIVYDYIGESKIICRKLERPPPLASLYQSYAYADQRLVVFKTKVNYYSNLITEAGSDSKYLIRTIDRLLHKKPEKCPPSFSSFLELSNNFVSFFENNIIFVRSSASIPWCLSHLGYIWFNAQLSIGFTYFECWIIDRSLAPSYVFWLLYLLLCWKKTSTCFYRP